MQVIDTVIRKIVKDLSSVLVSRGLQVEFRKSFHSLVFGTENSDLLETSFLNIAVHSM